MLWWCIFFLFACFLIFPDTVFGQIHLLISLSLSSPILLLQCLQGSFSELCVCVCVLIIGLSEVNACACCEAKKSLSFNLAYINTRTQTLILSVLLLFFLLVLFLVIALYCTEHRSNIVTEMLTHSSPQN